MTVTTNQAISLLENILYENSTLAAANAPAWVALSNNLSNSTVSQLAVSIAASPEITIVEEVTRLYLGVLGRTPDAAGLAYWTNWVETGMKASTIALGASAVPAASWAALTGYFAGSTEFTAKYANISGAAYVDLLYENVLNRAPDAAGLAFWTNALATGAASTGTLISSFVNSVEFVTDSSPVIAAALEANAVTIANGRSGATTISVVVPGVTYTLTSGVDTITTPSGNNSVINGIDGAATATTTTFSANDSITLGSTTGNTLNLTDLATTSLGTAALPIPSATVSDVQSLNISSNFNAFSLDTSTGWSGLTALKITSVSNAGDVDTITVGSSTSVVVNDSVNTAATTSALSVTGGTSVTITEANGSLGGAGITVTSDAATAWVSVTQTAGAAADFQAVTITDANAIVASVVLDGLGTAGASITGSALTSLTVNDQVGAATVTITDGTATLAKLALSLNNDANVTIDDVSSAFKEADITTGATKSTIVLTGASIATETIAGSSVVTELVTGSTALKTITISGGAGLTDNTDLAATLVAGSSITSTSTGVVNVTIDPAVTTFTGGAGQDIVTIAADATKAVTGGSATNNEIILNNAFGSFTSADTGKYVTGFSIAGFGAAASGAYDVSGDASSVVGAGIKTVDITADGTAAETFTVATGTALTIDATLTNAVPTIISNDKAGATDSIAVTLGASVVTVGALTLQDLSTDGIATVAISLADTTKTDTQTITTLTDVGLSALNVSGTANLDIGTLASDAATSLAISNTTTGTDTASVTIGALTDDTLATLSFSGSGATTITLLTDTAKAETITNSGTGAATVTEAPSATLATLNLNGSVAFTLGTADVGTPASATSGDTLHTGVTVAGSTDNAVVSLAIDGAASGKTDSITLGNGADTVQVLVGGGTENITLGNGANTVELSQVAAGTVDKIVLGTGVNAVTLGLGLDTVTFGTHAKADSLILTNSTTGSFATPTTTSQVTIIATAVDVVTGLVAGDTITVPGATSVAAATNLAAGGAATDVEVAHGTYSGTAGTFSYSSAGTDTLMTYGTGATAVSVVLVGFDFTSKIAISGGIVTLG